MIHNSLESFMLQITHPPPLSKKQNKQPNTSFTENNINSRKGAISKNFVYHSISY